MRAGGWLSPSQIQERARARWRSFDFRPVPTPAETPKLAREGCAADKITLCDVDTWRVLPMIGEQRRAPRLIAVLNDENEPPLEQAYWFQ